MVITHTKRERERLNQIHRERKSERKPKTKQPLPFLLARTSFVPIALVSQEENR